MAPITRRKLPKPSHSVGYPVSQLKAFFTKKQYQKFNKAFGVQTCALINGEIILYEDDVIRAVQGFEPLD